MLTAGFNLQLHTYTLYMYTKDLTKSNDKNNIKLNNVFYGCFFQWRRFNFFDKEILKDTESDQVYDKLKVHISQSNMYTCNFQVRGLWGFTITNLTVKPM